MQQSRRNSKLRLMLFLDNEETKHFSIKVVWLKFFVFGFAIIQLCFLLLAYFAFQLYHRNVSLSDSIFQLKSGLVASVLSQSNKGVDPFAADGVYGKFYQQIYARILVKSPETKVEELPQENRKSADDLQKALRESNLQLSNASVGSKPFVPPLATPAGKIIGGSTLKSMGGGGEVLSASHPSREHSTQDDLPKEKLRSASLETSNSELPMDDSEKLKAKNKVTIQMTPLPEGEDLEEFETTLRFEMSSMDVENALVAGTGMSSFSGRVCIVAQLKANQEEKSKNAASSKGLFVGYPSKIALKPDGRPKDLCSSGEEVRFSRLRPVLAGFKFERSEIESVVFYFIPKNSRFMQFKKFTF